MTKSVVNLDSVQQTIYLVIGCLECGIGYPESVKKSGNIFFRRKQLFVETKDMRRLFDKTQIPICFKRSELRTTQKTQVAGLRLFRPLQYFGNGRIINARIAVGAPFVNTSGYMLV